MIYLLSFDREIVVRALQEEQKCDGKEYLEKIIQVPFDIPEADKTLVNAVFFERLTNIIFAEQYNLDHEYWRMVFQTRIFPYIVNIRDVNRVLNAFEFKYNLMKDEIDAFDLLAITVLQIYAPEIFGWIHDNTDYLTGSIQTAGGITGVEQSKNRENYKKLFGEIYPEAPGRMLNIIQTLFPVFSWKTGGHNRYSDSNEELRKKDRIASAERIKRYFNLSLEAITISKARLKGTIYDDNDKQLNEYFQQLLRDNLLTEYIQELMAYIPDIPQDRIALLIKIQTSEEAYKVNSIFAPKPARICYNAMISIFQNNSAEKNLSLLKELISSGDISNISILCELVEEMEEAHGRIGKSVYSTHQFINDSEIPIIEKSLLERIKIIAETGNIFDYREVKYTCSMWKFLEKDSYDQYMKRLLCQPENVPKYLQLCAGTWSTGKMNGWKFAEENFSEYINKQDAYTRICSLKNTEKFSALDISDKQIAVAFYLWVNSETDDYYEINREKVDSLIPEWEKM